MNKLKRCIAIVVTLVFMATPCLAAENALKTVFEDSMYGGLAGGLVGAALLVFTHKPADHLDYIAYGAAGGVLVGAGYGVATASRSFAEIENGKVKFAMPTVKPELMEGNVKGQTTLVAFAELIRGKF